uniref:Uncharacterized protein n=1 Tax=Toxoplasma gondii COUG TaxID=1074873 RepID=A0A2G8XRC7_TOXGO|nr:hypothetical protein TGCOUG_211360 [Toxoplasma gondii COUG]
MLAEVQLGRESTIKEQHNVVGTLTQDEKSGKKVGDKRRATGLEGKFRNPVDQATDSDVARQSKRNPSLSSEKPRQLQGFSMTGKQAAEQQFTSGDGQSHQGGIGTQPKGGQKRIQGKLKIEGFQKHKWINPSPKLPLTDSRRSALHERQREVVAVASGIETATKEALEKLLGRAKDQQASLGEEWRRYEELEHRRLLLLSSRGRNKGQEETHRDSLREAKTEFRRGLASLQQTVDTLQKQLASLSVGRLVPRHVLLGATDSRGSRSDQQSLEEWQGRARTTEEGVAGHSEGVKHDRKKGSSSVHDLAFGNPTELVVLATHVQELLEQQQRLTAFLESLVSLQSHRLIQQHGSLEFELRHLQGKNATVSVRTSKIKKSRPERVQWRTYRYKKYGAGSRAIEHRMTASVFASVMEGSDSLGERLGVNTHFHQIPVQPPTKEYPVSKTKKPPQALQGNSPFSPKVENRERPKGKRKVVGGFEVFDDPEETVVTALQRFLYPAYSRSFIASLVPGSAGRRTQGIGGLAEATAHGRMEWLTDSTVFADRKLNEILEEKMRKRSIHFPLFTNSLRLALSGQNHPRDSAKGGLENDGPAVLDAVRYAENAAALSAFYDQVEREGAEEAKKKPDVGTLQDIVFQYSFDNVPLEHKRALWKEYLQVQLEDRGHEIVLPEEPPQAQLDDETSRDGNVFSSERKTAEYAARAVDNSPFLHQPLVALADEMNKRDKDAGGQGERHPLLMSNIRFLDLLADSLTMEADTRDGSSDAALKWEIPTLDTREFQAHDKVGGDSGNVFTHLSDGSVSKETLEDLLLPRVGFDRGNGALLGVDSWEFEDSLESDDSDWFQDNDHAHDDSFAWPWDLDFIVI